jgi:membrane-associated phospholipid phosphatase
MRDSAFVFAFPARRWRSAARGVTLRTAIVCALTLLALSGLAGLDHLAYQSIALQINTGNPLSGDFYQRTKPAWQLVRIMPYALGAIALWLAFLNRPRQWQPVVAALLTVLIVAATANVLQTTIGRKRPNATSESYLEFHPIGSGLLYGQPDGFPSGEAATVFAIAVAIGAACPAWRGVLVAAAIGAACTRWLTGMHFVSDVAVGALLAIALSGGLALRLTQAITSKSKRRPPTLLTTDA